MGKTYRKKTARSRRKLQKLDPNPFQVEVSNGRTVVQLMLPADDWMLETAGARQLQQILERPLGDLDLAVLILDGIEFQKTCLVVALGIDFGGRKHVLGLWPGATENHEVCAALLDELIERWSGAGWARCCWRPKRPFAV